MRRPIVSISRKMGAKVIYQIAYISPIVTRGLKWNFCFPDISVSLDPVFNCLQNLGDLLLHCLVILENGTDFSGKGLMITY